jgi:hypothetical protein
MKVKTPPAKQFRDVPDAMTPASLMTGDRPRWEYKSVLLPDTADLNRFGSEGWELVGVKQRPGDQAVFYFRRRIS